MQDQQINLVFGLLILFAVLSTLRARGTGFRYRRLQDEVARLRAERSVAAPQVHGPTLDQVQMLEDRVRVLERIVTDPNHNLAREIEALRDPRDSKETI